MNFSRPRQDGSWVRLDGELQPPFHTALRAFHIKATSKRCCPRVRMVVTMLHTITLVRTAAGRCCPDVQTNAAVFPHLCLRRKSDFLSNSNVHPDVLSWCSDECNLELFVSSRHWWMSERYCHVVPTDVADWWASGRFSGPSGRKQRIQLFWVGINTESSLNTEIDF
jgi:hypothetical protein